MKHIHHFQMLLRQREMNLILKYCLDLLRLQIIITSHFPILLPFNKTYTLSPEAAMASSVSLITNPYADCSRNGIGVVPAIIAPSAIASITPMDVCELICNFR